MQIACPNCGASYEIAAAALGADGRKVRCAHCKETWIARPAAVTAADAVADRHADAAPAGWSVREERFGDRAAIVAEDRFAGQPAEVEFALPHEMPEIGEAPPIAPQQPEAIDPAAGAAPADAEPDAAATGEEPDYHEVRRRREIRQTAQPRRRPLLTKQRLVAAMAGTIIALLFERENVARLMPHTASFYAAIRLPVNLRGLAFESVKAGMEQQDGGSALVIEGIIRNVSRQPVEVPRLRFAMRNAAGVEIYSWTAMPERAILPAGEIETFRTRLAAPPAESRQAYVRFFQRSDIVAANQR